jgi:hypothetical protein
MATALSPTVRERIGVLDPVFPSLIGGLVDVELVRVHGTLHHSLTEPVGGGDEHRAVEPGLRVHGEHHAGRADVAAHHALDPGGQGDVGVDEAVVHPVGDRPVVVQRGEDGLHRLEQVVDAADVQEGLLLAGEGGVGEVLGRRTGPHRPGHLVRTGVGGDEFLVGVPDVAFELLRERLLQDPAADLLTPSGEFGDVVGVEVLEYRPRSSCRGR